LLGGSAVFLDHHAAAGGRIEAEQHAQRRSDE
jgi:hypothetical protein